MNKENKQELLKRYLAGECSTEEATMVEQWYLLLKTNNDEIDDALMDQDVEEVRKKLTRVIRRKKTKAFYRYIAAAAVLCVLTFGGYFYYTTTAKLELSNNHLAHNATPIEDIEPRKNIAILQLEDGTEVELDNSAQSIIAQTGGNTAYINEEGQLEYEATAGAGSIKPITHTVKTPRGGQFQITLLDGSKVWLNAASQLTYTLDKDIGERVVELEGEAYFEVAKDEERPFKVYSHGQVIEVLGTHFNVNSYADEPATKTTLIEGAVKIVETTNGQSTILNPGQQAELHSNHRLRVSQVNLDEAVAWKNGKFNFNNADIEHISRQLARWYNVGVIFKGKPKNIKLSGEVHRDTPASKVLEILSFYDLNCKIETVNGVQQIIIE